MPRSDADKVDFYDSIAAIYDEFPGSLFYIPIDNVERALLNSYLSSLQRGSTTLDVGCGTGQYTEILAKHSEVEAIDPSKEMIRIARMKPPLANVRFFQCGLLEFSTAREFDIVVAFGSVLNHLRDWASAIRTISNLLRPSGVFLFTVDNLSLTGKLGVELSSSLPWKPSTGRSSASFLERTLSKDPYEAKWSLRFEGRNWKLTMYHQSMRMVRHLLRQNRFIVEHEIPVNVLVRTLPWFHSAARSFSPSNLLDIPPRWRWLVSNILRIDEWIAQWGGSIMSQLAANVVFACRKRQFPGGS